MAIVAGVTTSLLAGPFGWQSVFVLGAVATAILFVAGLRFLPESMDYLIVSCPRGTLVRLNRILIAIGYTRVEEQPRAVASCRKVAFTTLFSGRNAVLTVLD